MGRIAVLVKSNLISVIMTLFLKFGLVRKIRSFRYYSRILSGISQAKSEDDAKNDEEKGKPLSF